MRMRGRVGSSVPAAYLAPGHVFVDQISLSIVVALHLLYKITISMLSFSYP
jgi:hypothetical protein